MRFRSIQQSNSGTHGNNRPSLLNRDVRSRILAYLSRHKPFAMPDLDEVPPAPPPILAGEEDAPEPLDRVIDWGEQERPLRVLSDLLPPVSLPTDSRRGGADAVTRRLSPPSSTEGPDSGGGGLTGTGTTGRISKWTGATSLGNANIYEVSARIGINKPVPAVGTVLDVGGKSATTTLQITGGSPAAGKVLTATDGSGNATWQAPASGVTEGFVVAMATAL